MKLYFVRHGETDVNSGLQQAHTAQFDEPLNAAGTVQAEQLAEQLRDAAFDAIINSPFQRHACEICCEARLMITTSFW